MCGVVHGACRARGSVEVQRVCVCVASAGGEGQGQGYRGPQGSRKTCISMYFPILNSFLKFWDMFLKFFGLNMTLNTFKVNIMKLKNN